VQLVGPVPREPDGIDTARSSSQSPEALSPHMEPRALSDKMRVRWLSAVVACTLSATAIAAWVASRDQETRERLRRRVLIWRLLARRLAHLLTMRFKLRNLEDARRAELEEQFTIRTAEDVAAVLGTMKGAIMKLGQMVSFIAEGLPPPAREALASLQADVPPMAPGLVEEVLERELGRPPERVFLKWDPVPVAAASIGQVHRAVLRDGRVVAVKVQYPGISHAIKSDLDNVEWLYGMFAGFALKSLDVKGLVDELRVRMADEVDYTLEARNQSEFARRYAGHPFIRVPAVIGDLSTCRVLVSEWVGGHRWADAFNDATDDTRQHAAEVLMRFALGSIYRHRVFNGDPHPGNYRFHDDGSITFLDFGLVKRWKPAEFDRLAPVLDAVLEGDATTAVAAAIAAGFLGTDHGLDVEGVYEFISGPYEPFITEQFTYTAAWVSTALRKALDVEGAHAQVLEQLNMPASYVILDRVVWGLSALLGRLHATNRWGAILAEYRRGAPPATELGRLEAEWQRSVVGRSG
jgi:predicted unusual protein kinase regulating ubiquinone biosynthesis (AarF/ABC1/UbiB family)